MIVHQNMNILIILTTKVDPWAIDWLIDWLFIDELINW